MWGCCKIIWKKLLAAMNITIVCGAILMIAFVADNLRHRSLRTDYPARVMLMIVNCILLISVAALGIIVSLYEWANVARIHAYVLVVVVLIQTGIAVFAVTQFKTEDQTKEDLVNAVDRYGENKRIRGAVDGIQKDDECCGIDSPEDWSKRNQEIPDSCKDKDGEVYQRGCLEPFHRSIVTYITVVASTHFFLAVFLGVDAGMVFYVARHFTENLTI
nr:unnamed protein product [Callosobruchus chinensis]